MNMITRINLMTWHRDNARRAFKKGQQAEGKRHLAKMGEYIDSINKVAMS